MARLKRCIFCGEKVREDGYCVNVDCVDYERTKIHDGTNEEQSETTIKAGK